MFVPTIKYLNRIRLLFTNIKHQTDDKYPKFFLPISFIDDSCTMAIKVSFGEMTINLRFEQVMKFHALK